jgi:hypothetical protein
MDIESIQYFNQVFNKINSDFLKDFEMEEITLESYFSVVLKNIQSLNDVRIKSLFIYYNHDLENRSSFNFEEENCTEFIKYKHDNFDVTKETLYANLKDSSTNLTKLIYNQINTNPGLKEFLKFLFYLDNRHFVDLFTLFIMVNFENLKSSNIHTTLINKNYKTNSIFEKELRILQENLGLY